MSGKPLMLVGLGASAGGVQAFRRFFERVPADSGMAYVAILHLSPEHESHLAEVLQASATIPVTTVQDRVRVEANHAYVVSPRQSLAVSDGWLVPEATRIEDRRAPIDVFFRTMAESHRDDAVCIVLSGTGADGAMGLKRVKEEGGLCLVQDPSDAEYHDMPRNAMATGLVDGILAAGDMPARLVAYRDRRRLVRQLEKPEDRAADERALHEVFSLVRLRTGHDFSNYKRATVLRRVERRLGVREIDDFATYATFLREHPEETQALLKDLLVSVTSFFRDPEAFAAFERDVVPKLFEGRGDDMQVRAWVPGCATGEEAYSIAMLLAEYASSAPESPTVQVFASDLDEDAISVAREGVYTPIETADVSPERLRRFFIKESESFRVRKELRDMVLFAHHNLVKDPPFSHLDLVSCQNLLIYLNRKAQQRVLEVFHFALNPAGYLFLGTSESVEDASQLFAPVNKDAHVYQSRGGPAKVAVRAQALTFGGVPRPLSHDPSEQAGRGRQLPADLHLRLLEQYAPPSVVVNEDHDIVNLTERAGRFLHFAAGEPSTNLVKVVRPELRLELRAALYQAAQQRTSVDTGVLAVSMADDRVAHVVIRVRPVLRHDDPARGFFLVLFGEVPGQRVDAPPQVPHVSAVEPMRQLEEETSRLKSQLRITIEQYETQAEELKASNEELQAANEELQSVTEELETGKEELQSVNEELRTVNQELRVKIDEEMQASNDIQNLINSTDLATVFIDRTGHIKMFTPRARDLFALIPGDRDRPLTDITNELVEVDLAAGVDRVLDRLERVEREVRSRAGRRYLMRLAPYRTADDRIDGVVLTFVDVTELRVAGERVVASESRLQRAFEVETVGILFFDLDGVAIDANDAFLRLTGYSRETLRSGGLRWHMLPISDLHGQFASALQALQTSGHAPSYEIECLRPDGTVWSAVVASRRLSSVEAVAFLVDITDRRRLSPALVDSDRRRNEFLAALAHELRNPLAPIAAALDVMKLSSDGSRMEQARQVMERQVTHIISLVEDLLELSRITLGKIDVRRDAVDLATALRTAIETSSTAIEQARHSLLVAITPGPLIVHGDAVRLTQVFSNLLSNAAKYTPYGGTIRLTAERMNDTAVVTLADNGIGIAPQTLPYVFDMFTQGVQPSGSARSGLGIGLALVRTLVEAHGGTVEARSAGLRHGSTFVVRLPVVNPPAAPTVTAAAPTTDISAHRIVVVDDNQDAANSLEALLSTLGAEVRVAYGGEDGLALVREHRPSVAFIDLGMPGMDGFAVARAISDDAALSPVLIALTGWGQPDIQRRTVDAGFHHHLTKPASLEQLQAILAKVPPPA